MKRFRMKAYLLLTLILVAYALPGCGGDAGNGHWDQPGTDATLVSIIVTPNVANILVNGTQPYKATATLSDLSTIDVTTDPNTVWSSDDTGIASFKLFPVVDGIADGLAVGTANITATYKNTLISPSVVLNVTEATPTAASCDGPGPVDMGAASGFGVLVGPMGGATLTITNPTTVNGDVGAASYIPAIGPSSLVGIQYTGVDVPYVDAKAAMLTAISCASNRPCSPGLAFNIGADHDFGGDVLDPGVYCVTGGMSLGSPLTLTNPGVYVFRSSGSLTTADNISMTFGGTANATNTSVFWVPTGSATIGADNAFLGTIMPEASAATTLGANTTLLGRVLSNSDVNLDNNTITVP